MTLATCPSCLSLHPLYRRPVGGSYPTSGKSYVVEEPDGHLIAWGCSDNPHLRYDMDALEDACLSVLHARFPDMLDEPAPEMLDMLDVDPLQLGNTCEVKGCNMPANKYVRVRAITSPRGDAPWVVAVKLCSTHAGAKESVE